MPLGLVRILTALVLLAGCGPAASRTAAPSAPAVVTTLDEPKHGIRLVYPGDWIDQTFLQPHGTIVLLQLPGDASSSRIPPTFSLVAQDPSQPPQDLNAMEDRVLAKARNQIDGLELLETADTTLGGEPARRVIYAGRKLGMPIRVMNVLAVHAERGYAAVFMSNPEAFDASRPAVQRVIDSVQFSQ